MSPELFVSDIGLEAARWLYLVSYELEGALPGPFWRMAEAMFSPFDPHLPADHPIFQQYEGLVS